MALNSRTGLPTPTGLTGPSIEAAQQTNGGVWVPSTFMRALDDNGDLVDLKAETDGRQRVASSGRPDVAGTTSAALTAVNAAHTVAVTRSGHVTIQWVAAFTSGTAQFEASYDNQATWQSMKVAAVSTTANSPSTSTANPTAGQVNAAAIFAGMTHIRVRVSAYTSGSPTVRINQSDAPIDPASIGLVLGTVGVTFTPRTSAGTLASHLTSAFGGGGAVAKASSGQLYGWQFVNTTASWRWLKIFNKATTGTLGTDQPTMVAGLPPGTYRDLDLTYGIPFSTGIAWAVTQGVANLDTVASAVGDVVGSLHYA